jgi:ADP-heptose:LPS heptosyltransferase
MVELGMERVVLVRALKGLGDFLCVVPALRALRAALPHSHITLLGPKSSEALATRFSHYIDELLPFPGFPGIPEAPVDVTRLPAFFAQAQACRFDLAPQMHGNGALMNPFTVMLGARTNAGYHAPGAYCPDPERFLLLEESDHEVQRWLRLLEHLGVPSLGRQLEFPLTQTDWDLLQGVPEAADLYKSRYIVIHPGASEMSRRWSLQNFASVADYLARDGFRVVLSGVSDEAGIADDVAARMRYPAVNLAGRTGLGALAALLSEASLLVSNDTGVSHLAAALRVPSVILFMASDPQRWAPLNRDLHRIVGRNGLRPEAILPGAVLHEAYRLLEAPRAAGPGAAAFGKPQSTASADVAASGAVRSPEVASHA